MPDTQVVRFTGTSQRQTRRKPHRCSVCMEFVVDKLAAEQDIMVFGALAQSQKAPVSLVMSVRLSVCPSACIGASHTAWI